MNRSSLRKAARYAAALGSAGSLLAAIALTEAPPAQASVTGTPTCGETITTSLTLTANLDCSADTTTSALIIGASGVTVNLNGFSILGPGANASTIGIDDRSGYNSLTVKNGSMSNLYGDVMAIGSPSSILTGLTVHKLKATSNTIDNGYAVCASYVDGARVNGLNVSDDEYGVVLANSTTARLFTTSSTAPSGPSRTTRGRPTTGRSTSW
jgi:hypothetical protein